MLKAPAGVEELRERFGLGEKYTALAEKLLMALDADPDTLVLETSGRGDERAKQAICDWVDRFTR